jgi:small subunit ribosomal protein S16
VAVKIKLKRLGKIRAPYYRIVVADARTKRDGRAIEEIGKYHPKAEPSFIEVDSERAQHWLAVGAQPTDPVRKILEITGDWQKFKGLPGTEGTLKTAAPREDRKEIFAAAVKETLGDATAPPKGRGSARSAPAKDKEASQKEQVSAQPDTTADTAAGTSEKPARGRSGGGRGSRAGAPKDGAAKEGPAKDGPAKDTAKSRSGDAGGETAAAKAADSSPDADGQAAGGE